MSDSPTLRPSVGVGVFVIKDGKILMLRRKGAHGDGTWGLIGGHLEFGESWEACVIREVQEEVGVSVANIRLFAVTNDVFLEENKHYVTLFMLADWESGEPAILEPGFGSELAWCTYETMPENLFLPIKNLKKSHPVLPV